MDIKFLKTKREFLEYCKDDWTPLFFIEAFVDKFYLYKDSEMTKKTTLEMIKKLLEEKLIIAGDLLPGNTFVKWDNNIDEIISKIKFKWDNLNRELVPHEIVWFDITKKGEKEFEYLDSLDELKDPIYYFRIFKGGQKQAQKFIKKLAKSCPIESIKNDTLRNIKVYKFANNSQCSYRRYTRFGKKMVTLDIKIADVNKYIRFEYEE